MGAARDGEIRKTEARIRRRMRFIGRLPGCGGIVSLEAERIKNYHRGSRWAAEGTEDFARKVESRGGAGAQAGVPVPQEAGPFGKTQGRQVRPLQSGEGYFQAPWRRRRRRSSPRW
jgi:hypothetical protein